MPSNSHRSTRIACAAEFCWSWVCCSFWVLQLHLPLDFAGICSWLLFQNVHEFLLCLPSQLKPPATFLNIPLLKQSLSCKWLPIVHLVFQSPLSICFIPCLRESLIRADHDVLKQGHWFLYNSIMVLGCIKSSVENSNVLFAFLTASNSSSVRPPAMYLIVKSFCSLCTVSTSNCSGGSLRKE